eukprot:354490-Chlamydomonas_euryale.AAC.4
MSQGESIVGARRQQRQQLDNGGGNRHALFGRWEEAKAERWEGEGGPSRARGTSCRDPDAKQGSRDELQSPRRQAELAGRVAAPPTPSRALPAVSA